MTIFRKIYFHTIW